MLTVCIALATSLVCKDMSVQDAFQVLSMTRHDPVLDCRDIYNPKKHSLRIECHDLRSK